MNYNYTVFVSILHHTLMQIPCQHLLPFFFIPLFSFPLHSFFHTTVIVVMVILGKIVFTCQNPPPHVDEMAEIIYINNVKLVYQECLCLSFVCCFYCRAVGIDAAYFELHAWICCRNCYL